MPSYRFLLISILIFLISVNIYAADKYRKFDRRMDMVDFLEISAGAKSTTYSVYGATGEAPLTFDDSKISRSGDKITINGEPLLDRDGFIILGSTYSPDLIDKTELSFDNKLTVIRFMRRSPESQPKFRSRKKNNIAIFDDINIAGSDFIRGSVVSFWSDIIIEGEVNEDVIAVHGNISIGKQAVVRGDVVAIDGKIDIAGKRLSTAGYNHPVGKNIIASIAGGDGIRRKKISHRLSDFTIIGLMVSPPARCAICR